MFICGVGVDSKHYSIRLSFGTAFHCAVSSGGGGGGFARFLDRSGLYTCVDGKITAQMGLCNCKINRHYRRRKAGNFGNFVVCALSIDREERSVGPFSAP